jgi:hypothetical protein
VILKREATTRLLKRKLAPELGYVETASPVSVSLLTKDIV